MQQRSLSSVIVLSLLLCVCGGEPEAAPTAVENPAEPAVDPPASKGAPKTDPAPAKVDPSMGLKCVKTIAKTQNTAYFGLLEKDGVSVIATRTEKRLVEPGEDTGELITTSYQYDDGKESKTQIITVAGGKTKEGLPLPSAFNPAEYKEALEIAPHILGSCSEWKVDTAIFSPPK